MRLLRRAFPPLTVVTCLVFLAACAGPDDNAPTTGDSGGATAATNGPGAAEPAGSTDDHDHEDDADTFESAAVRYAEDVFDADAGDYGVSFAPDGQTLYFTRPSSVGETIFLARRAGESWSDPEAAPFSGRFHDKEPYAAADGRRVFFASKRPLAGTIARQDFEIWYVERDGGGGGGWGEPQHVAAASSAASEDYPAVAADGTLVFTRNDDIGNFDLWLAAPSRGGWGTPAKLPFPVNTGFTEADPWISPDGDLLIFSSNQSSSDAQGQGDLYVVRRQGDGWSRPASLGLHVNDVSHEYGPAMSPDGATFYFSRGFFGSVWSVPTALLDNLD